MIAAFYARNCTDQGRRQEEVGCAAVQLEGPGKVSFSGARAWRVQQPRRVQMRPARYDSPLCRQRAQYGLHGPPVGIGSLAGEALRPEARSDGKLLRGLGGLHSFGAHSQP